MSKTKSCDNCIFVSLSDSDEPCKTCVAECKTGNEAPCWKPVGKKAADAPVDKEPLGPTGFVRDTHAGKGRMDLLPWIGIMEVSKLCEEGAEHYGERNIDKGAPLHSLLDSAARHMAKLMSGYTDEDHLRALCWNALWALQERTTHPELNDTPWPWYEKKEDK